MMDVCQSDKHAAVYMLCILASLEALKRVVGRVVKALHSRFILAVSASQWIFRESSNLS
jgi:hypothetical protein